MRLYHLEIETSLKSSRYHAVYRCTKGVLLRAKKKKRKEKKRKEKKKKMDKINYGDAVELVRTRPIIPGANHAVREGASGGCV